MSSDNPFPGRTPGPQHQHLVAGAKVGGNRYALVRPLGRGGMGAVWLAQDERLHEQVALKFLPLEIRSDATALDELRRETARSHKLTHVNIVRIHDLHEEDGGLAFIAMEYVDGRGRPDYALGATLYELLTSKPPFYTGDLTRQILNELPEPVSERLAA